MKRFLSRRLPTDTRHRRALRTTATSWIAKLVSIGVQFLTVPLALDHLGPERYGVWLTVSVTIGWLTLASLGQGPSIINLYAETAGAGDSSARRAVVATALGLRLRIATLLLFAMCVVVPNVSWTEVFGAPESMGSELRWTVGVVWFAQAIAIPLSLGTNILHARQTGWVAASWLGAGAILKLVAVWTAVLVRVDLPLLAAALVVTPLLTEAGAFIHMLTGETKPLLARRSYSSPVAKHLLRMGLAFFWLNVSAIFISGIDNVLISKTLGPEAVTPYALTWMISQVSIMALLLLLDGFWPAFTDAAARGEQAALQTLVNTSLAIGLALVGLAGVVLLAFGTDLIRLWAGPTAVPSQPLIWVMVALSLVQASVLPFGRTLSALNHLKENAWIALLNAIINISVSLLLVRPLGIVGVALGTLIGYLVTGVLAIAFAQRAIASVSSRARAFQAAPALSLSEGK